MIVVLQQAVLILHPALSCFFMSCNFMFCIFMSCKLVRYFHVFAFHVLQFGPSISCPALSCPVNWSVISMSWLSMCCNSVLQFHDLHFQSQQLMGLGRSDPDHSSKLGSRKREDFSRILECRELAIKVVSFD